MSTIELASNTSSIVARRGAEWSSATPDPRARLTVSFPHPWNTRSGPVFDWYYQQRYTRFKTIQHRRTRDAPFFHEFLLVKLHGGYICRLERTGDGSDVGALRRRGSIAHDLIQCYSADSPFYQMDQQKSDLIDEIYFPCELDLLDILAIFYAIHLGDSSQKYTLTRYNCYLVCWAILGVLSRGVTKWENMITPDSQKIIINEALNKLLNPSQDSLPIPAEYSIIFDICSMLQLNCGFIVDALRKELCSGPTQSHTLRDALAGAFWSSNWASFLRPCFELSVSKAADISLDSSSMHARLKQTLTDVLPSIGHGGFSALFKRGTHKHGNIDKFKEAVVQYSRNLALGDQTSVFHRAKQYVRGGFSATRSTVSAFIDHKDQFETDNRLRLFRKLFDMWRIQKTLRDIDQYRERMAITGEDCIPPEILRYEEDQADCQLAQSLVMLRATRHSEQRSKLILDAVGRNRRDSNQEGQVLWAKWLGLSFYAILERSITESIRIDQAASISMSNLLPGAGAANVNHSIIEFQNYLKLRIRSHAERVEFNSLGQEDRIVRDIEYELARVWASMPLDVGTYNPSPSWSAWTFAGSVVGMLAMYLIGPFVR